MCYLYASPFVLITLNMTNRNTYISALDQAIDDLLQTLLTALGLSIDNTNPDDPYRIEKWPSDLPQPSISMTSVTERALAIGNRRGVERLGSFAVVDLKGGRLDAIVRFQVLGNPPEVVDAAVEELHRRLLAAKNFLWKDGIVRLAAEETSMLEYVPTQYPWRREERKTSDYRILYEFHYYDADGAESLIARIPINIDGESTTVTDEMTRWDNQAAPKLEVHGGTHKAFNIGSLDILAFLPDGWDGNEVTMFISVGDAVRESTFPSVREFLEAFELEAEREEGDVVRLKTVELGGNPYHAGRLVFPNRYFSNPIILKGVNDVFRVSYADERLLDENGSMIDSIVYLKLINLQ